MWLRSKYEDLIDGIYMNEPVNLSKYRQINKDDGREGNQFRIHFYPAYMVTNYDFWDYETKEQRDSEYNFILSQLDCRVNDESQPSQKNERVRILRIQHGAGAITVDQWIDGLIKIIEG